MPIYQRLNHLLMNYRVSLCDWKYVCYFFFFTVVFLVTVFAFGFVPDFNFALVLAFACGIAFGAHTLLLLTATLPQFPQ